MGNIDIGLIPLIRNLITRVARLEAQGSAVRRNDIRLGDVVVKTDPTNETIVMTNVNTKARTHLGIPAPAEFSYSGVLGVAGDDTDYAPPHTTTRNTVVTEIVLALRETASGTVTVQVWTNSGKSMVSVSLLAGDTVVVQGTNIPVQKNTLIYPKITASGTDAHDLSVTVRFGQPLTGDLSGDES